jgi:hypothetical protein
LVNCYLLALYSDIGIMTSEREIDFRSQQDFRRQLIDSLLGMSKASNPSPKKRVAHLSFQATDILPIDHIQIKRPTRRDCVVCKGLRMSDRPQKRQPLAQIAGNNGRISKRRSSWYGCHQCDINICKGTHLNSCWSIYHNI